MLIHTPHQVIGHANVKRPTDTTVRMLFRGDEDLDASGDTGLTGDQAGALVEGDDHLVNGSLEVDHQLVLDRRLHREVGRLLAPEDAIDVAGLKSEKLKSNIQVL